MNIIISIKIICQSKLHNSENSLEELKGECTRPVRLRFGRISYGESDELEMAFRTTLLKSVEDAHLLGSGVKSTQYLDRCTDILLISSVLSIGVYLNWKTTKLACVQANSTTVDYTDSSFQHLSARQFLNDRDES